MEPGGRLAGQALDAGPAHRFCPGVLLVCLLSPGVSTIPSIPSFWQQISSFSLSLLAARAWPHCWRGEKAAFSGDDADQLSSTSD